jgi:hypothetical protein
VELTNDWIAGLVTPKSCILPSEEFAKNVSDYTVKKLKSTTPKTIDVYVSHDTYIGSIMFHWFGIPIPRNGVDFLDGFVLQLYDDKMIVYYRNNEATLDYPQWWSIA